MKLSSKLLIWFSVVSVVIATITIGISWSFFNTKQKASDLSGDINNVYFGFLKLKNITNDFFALETIDTTFYVTGESEYLEQAYLQTTHIRESLKDLVLKHENSTNVIESIQEIEGALRGRDSIFSMLSVFAAQRGFKDYGMIGHMRDYAHRLEKKQLINKVDLLSLRRREKDYLLRHHYVYVQYFNKIADKIRHELIAVSSSHPEAEEILYELKQYNVMFLKVSQLDTKMGLHDNSGLKGKLNEVDKEVELKFNEALNIANFNKEAAISQIEKTFILTVAFILLICFFLANILSRQVTKPLSRLTRFIEGILLNDFRKMPSLGKAINTHEIKVLYREFNLMIDQLKQNQKEKDVLINQLSAGEKKYREMADKLPQGLFETDNSGVLLYVNKVWQDYFGYQKSEVEYNLNMNQIISRRKNIKGIKEQHEVVAHRSDKSWFPALIYMDEIVVNGEQKGYRGVIVDISERYEYVNLLKRERRKAQESDRLKSAFLANISHEIRTPINAILGFTTLLKNKNFTLNERQVYHDIIEKSSKELLKVFEDMIAVSRLESDDFKLEYKNVNLKEFADELKLKALTKASEMDKKLLQVNYEEVAGSDYLDMLTIDKQRVLDVLDRLMENAVKFTSEGHITLGHKVQKSRIIFFVKDSGIGIPKDKQQLIFDPFRQVDESNTKIHGGVGLGLSICKGLVTQMQGTIWMDSVPGEGAGFYFSIPFKKVSNYTLASTNFCTKPNLRVMA